MTDPDATHRAAVLELAAAVAAALGPLLIDKDVSSVDVVEGGLPEVVRRGKRERLQALIEGPLFALLRDHGATSSMLQETLPGGVVLNAGPLSDGRIAVSARRAAPTDVALDHLVEEGLIPPGVDTELCAAVSVGQGLVIIGPAQAARTRLAVAVARVAARRLRVVALTGDVPAQALPAPAAADLVDRARAACDLGADVLFALHLTAAEYIGLLKATLPVPVVASVAVSSMALLRVAADGLPLDAAGLVAVCGFDPEGRPRLVELHGDAAGMGPPPAEASPVTSSMSSSLLSSSSSSPTMADAPALPVMPTALPSAPTVSGRRSGLHELPVLGDAPPAEWASQDIDDDPGWELGPVVASTPPAPAGSFDAALDAVSKRPVFAPRAPPPHPQITALRGTGGLTFEPPGGGPAVDDGDVGDDGGGAADDDGGTPR